MDRGTNPRRIIVTADDAGLRPGWDRAIWEASRAQGLVTAVSVVTSGPTSPEACARLRENPAVDAGVHLDLIASQPLTPRRQVRSLVGADGRFPGSVSRFLALYLARRLDPDEIRGEWARQIQASYDAGLRPIHLNSHCHVHLLAGLFGIAADLARTFGIPFIRVVSDPPWLLFGPALRPGTLLKVLGLWGSGQLARRALARAGSPRVVPSWGAGLSDSLGEEALLRLVGRVREGTTEIICHPGQSAAQTAAVTSPGLRARVDARAALVRFRALEDR